MQKHVAGINVVRVSTDRCDRRGGNRKNDLYASGSFLQGKQKTDLRQTLLMKIAIIGHFQNLS